jgi:hypothetical protein
MPSRTRRAVLSSGAVALAALAGCGGQRDDPPEYPIIDEIGVSNHHDQAHSVGVYAELEGEVKLWRSFDLTAVGGDRSRVVVEPPAFPRESGRWHVGIRRLDAEERHAFVPRIVDDQCLTLSLFVTENGGLNHGVDSHSCDQ